MPRPTIEQLDERRKKLLEKARAVTNRRNKMARTQQQKEFAEGRVDARIRGSVHERDKQSSWAADPLLKARELEDLARRLVDARERKAFGLKPELPG